jgi:hypothetical protein
MKLLLLLGILYLIFELTPLGEIIREKLSETSQSAYLEQNSINYEKHW